ncbi:restriction endonuclease subunit S [Desulfosudis oleivorans]|uniref:Restriction modification system DNA specificity domain n=1 Tax=Desulfosudis oleivorans (strain DSM 6200 / JCM 39069 / Hxd3) TaxID=96561 RepID=A8ZUV1_DESOH|nr:restriction endonuclease subunit S [Desulfosudis oleivorans]ABW68041.1 restriction modification system DNA specificity domain [Desulfosudis oleivorans Hxd3]
MDLHEVCDLIVDCEHKTAPTQAEGYPSIRTPNIGRGYFLLDGVNRVSEETYRSWTRRAEPKPGDLIMAREAPVGNVAMVPAGLRPCLGQRTLLIRPMRSKVFPRYLAYLLIGDQIQNIIHAMTNGVTVPHLNMKDVRSLPLPPLPPLPTQRKIAAILSAYDDLIENNLRRIKILEEMAQNLYREWFVKFRFPGWEKARFVDSPLGKIPEEWEVTTINKVTSYINRGVTPKYDASASSLVVNQKCIRDRKLNLSLARQHKSRVMDDKYVVFGDILINSTGVGTLGRVAQVYEDLNDVTVDTHVSIVRPSNGDGIDFLGLALIDLEPHFESLGAGATGQTELRRDRIGETEIVLPPVKMRKQFSEKVTSLRKLVLNLAARNETLRRTRDLLLPKLISGEVDVSELDIAIPEEAA